MIGFSRLCYDKMELTENTKITLTVDQLRRLCFEDIEHKKVCHRCGEVKDVIFDSQNYYCPGCWTELCREELEIDEKENFDNVRLVREDSEDSDDEDDEDNEDDEEDSGDVVDKLRDMLEDLPSTGGYIYFSYVKLDGTLRHAKAQYKYYIPSSNRREKPPDIITYFDSVKYGWRCCHEYQLTDEMPVWKEY